MTLTGTPTRVAIVGGAGKVSRQLIPLLLEAGIEVVPLARRDEQLAELKQVGAEPRRLDIEEASADEFLAAFEGCDGIVFSAGGGADGNAERKRTVDLQGSLKSMEAARALGIDRFVQVSAMGVDQPVEDSASEAWKAYVQAKRDADAALRNTQLAWTIIRPGGLTDDDGTGLVTLASEVERGTVPRADVAAVIAACLTNENAVGQQWELVSGSTPVAEAVSG
ncbi:SDR family oxidoreductase [Demequina sp. TTPB684]|uniref:SDR family oxidoreductase n=1 Tax=unclassified Demequina TaxID=2620311 RepID=UPI001CF5E807|nr:MULTISPECIES: SDR family oxidoreductase [unclassified Demequina]MCB2413408.1 SDR family oxidoreductase [Demequina sp. TTPB684]UPU87971.1 SDR family oxidoreductase [Demequina sp. TMPB413]